MGFTKTKSQVKQGFQKNRSSSSESPDDKLKNIFTDSSKKDQRGNQSKLKKKNTLSLAD